jgi:hypothetical protein
LAVRVTDLSFDEWIEHAFSHEVRFQRLAWFFDADHDWWDPQPVEAVAYLTRLFEQPLASLERFSDGQIAQGLTYLVSTSASGDRGWLCSNKVPVSHRVRCIEAIASLFNQLFDQRCTPHLSHLSETGAGALNTVCYMWWKEFPCIALPDDPHFDVLHDSALRTMERILHLASLPCPESALHGLGHWYRSYPIQTTAIIDRFLAARPDLDPRLMTYARSARCGCVL